MKARVPFFLVLVAGVFLITREPSAFKVTMDELVLMATSMSMHYGRISSAVVRGFEVGGVFQDLGGILDKRPLFFPWLLSLVHDIAGYRVSNAFVLNGGLTFVLLSLVYQAGHWLRDRRAGIFAVLLITTLPLLAQNASGAGFEILNVVMILGAILTGACYVRTPNAATQGLFLFTTVLLANVRYESALYVICAGVVILFEWRLRKRILIEWPMLITPFLFIPIPWRIQIFWSDREYWQLPSGLTQPFGFQHVYENIGHLLVYFLDLTGRNSSSPVLAAAAVVGCGLCVMLLFRYGKYLSQTSPDKIVFLIFMLGVMANLVLLLMYFWGQADKYEVSRLVLPFFVLGALAWVFAVGPALGRKWVWRGALGLALISAYFITIPAMSKAIYSNGNYHVRRMEWCLDFHGRLPAGKYLYIARDHWIFTINKVSGIPIDTARGRVDQVKYHMDKKTFDGVYVIQNIFIDPDTGARRPLPENDVGAAYVLDPVAQRSFRPFVLTQISRVTAIDPEKKTIPITPSDLIPQRPGAEMNYDDVGWFRLWSDWLP